MAILITGGPPCIRFELSSQVKPEALGGSNCGISFHLNNFGSTRSDCLGLLPSRDTSRTPRISEHSSGVATAEGIAKTYEEAGHEIQTRRFW
jgi:hypothetical protein